ncbi:hypothetical protein B0H17DRAFT_1222314 [Mycena rosella]|uniref:Uncharacterized protein n=1 Tax=Mycena rosella TaxID=1033263 RepID=A0AAD7AY26_MYCRO|nr:hypothetical protein B0H17DRAFT_1222314 [Mycena rosella]
MAVLGSTNGSHTVQHCQDRTIDANTLPQTPADEWAGNTNGVLGMQETDMAGPSVPGAFPEDTPELARAARRARRAGLTGPVRRVAVPVRRGFQNFFYGTATGRI